MSEHSDQLELFDLGEIDGVAEALFEKQFNKTLRSVGVWMNRTSLTKTQRTQATETIRQSLLDGASPEDITYCFTHTGLLKSKKIVTETILSHAIQKVTVDKEAGKEAHRLFQNWHTKWYKNYVQNEGVIVKAIKDALLRGVAYEALEEAMTVIGSQKQVVSDASIQYALVIAEKRRTVEKNAGMNNLKDENEVGTLMTTNEFYSNGDAPW